MSSQPLKIILDQPGERLDRALVKTLPDISRTQVQRLIKEGHITIKGTPVKANLRLEGGEEAVVILPEVVETELIPEDIPLDIRYEDDELLLINKPAGMVVHPGAGHESGTLVNAVLAYCPDVLNVGGEKRPGIVHRLDKDTSGLILVAKTDRALQYLQDQFKDRTIKKRYVALVEGQLQPPTALIDAPIGRDTRQRKKMAVITSRHGTAQARPAQTMFNTITAYDDYTLVECMPQTGRTHQIRVHMAFVGHPLVGDKVYGRRKQQIHIKRHFLHAAGLVFKRPLDHQTLTFESELPSDLAKVLDELASL
ncbi:MAG: RluA family pseudouridine synthase [Chloroflexi bacterium]|nr:MAG: RluA family pseudouridine synthase [Chloroflexota bacterium]